MALQRFDIASLAASPWKNGGGTTREIVVLGRAGADMDGFDWRVSIATIDRRRAVLRLCRRRPRDHAARRRRRAPASRGDGRIDHRLDVPHAPFAFAGDTALDCDLLGGTLDRLQPHDAPWPCQRRSGCWRERDDIAPTERGLLMVLGGRWRPSSTPSTAGRARALVGRRLARMAGASARTPMPRSHRGAAGIDNTQVQPPCGH